MSDQIRDIDRPQWFGEAFDAVDWRLTLYENGKVGYDDTIRAIVTAITQIADPVAVVRRGVESGTIKGEVLMEVTEKNAPVLADGRYLAPGHYMVIPVSDGGSET